MSSKPKKIRKLTAAQVRALFPVPTPAPAVRS